MAHPVRLRLLNPSWALAASLLTYGFGLLLAPVESAVSISFESFGFWLLVSSFFWLGLRLGSGAGSSAPFAAPYPRPPSSSRLSVVVALGAIGLLMLFVERYFIRGAPLSFDIFAIRDAIESKPPGVIAILGSFLGAFAPLTWIACKIIEAQGSEPRIWLRRFSLLLVLLYTGFSLAAGSRTVMLVVVILHAVCLFALAGWQGKRLPIRASIWIGVLIFFLLACSVWLMLSRLEQMGLDPLVSIQVSGYAESLKPSQAALQWIERHPDYSAVLAAAFSICLYIYHGLFEFGLLFSSFSSEHTFGAYTLWLPVKLLQLIGLPLDSVNPANLQGVREGLYTTFVGPLYIDFGYLSMLAALLMGCILGYPSRRLRAGNAIWLIPSALIVAIVSMYPIMNILDSTAGAYLLVSGLCLATLFLPPRHQRIKTQIFRSTA